MTKANSNTTAAQNVTKADSNTTAAWDTRNIPLESELQIQSSPQRKTLILDHKDKSGNHIYWSSSSLYW
jgi:hypothetical protein